MQVQRRRGCWGDFPEEELLAFLAAVVLKGGLVEQLEGGACLDER